MSNFGNVRMEFDDKSPYAIFDQQNSTIDTNLEDDEVRLKFEVEFLNDYKDIIRILHRHLLQTTS